jgi:hypothetical protein
MAKIVKLSISDIENIVKKTIKEAEFDDFDTKVQPEELPGADSYEEEQAVLLSLAQDEQGNFYVVKDAHTDNPEVVAKGN